MVQHGTHLYVMQSVSGLIKIGRSSNPKKRARALEQASGQRIKVLCVLPDQGHRERAIHDLLAQYRTLGEWFLDISRSRSAIIEALGGVKIKWLYAEAGNLAKAREVRRTAQERRNREITEQAFAHMIRRIEEEGAKKAAKRAARLAASIPQSPLPAP